MNQFLKEKLSNILNSDDWMSCEYRSIYNTSKKDINFSNIRGSVRMMVGMVSTPIDIRKKIDKFLSTSLPV